jgi:protein tyrosine phosphatase (PTP) superfamily phosphohydrolase (DUF442 family)
MAAYPLKRIRPSLAVAYAPRLESDLKTIHAAGIRTIVNLCAECYDLEVAAKAAGFEIYFLPVVDEAAPGKFPKAKASLANKFFDRLQAALKWHE